MLIYQLYYLRIENVSANADDAQTEYEQQTREARVSPDIITSMFHEVEEVVSQPFSPGELGSQYGDPEQEEDHTSRARQCADETGGDNEEHSKDKRQDSTRTVGETFPGQFHALHMSSIPRVVT